MEAGFPEISAGLQAGQHVSQSLHVPGQSESPQPPISLHEGKEGLCASAQFEGIPGTCEFFTSWVLRNLFPDFPSLKELLSELVQSPGASLQSGMLQGGMAI